MNLEKKVTVLRSIAQENHRYIFISMIFVAAFFYNHSIVPSKVIKTNKQTKESSLFIEKPDLDGKMREKVYSRVLHAQAGDAFRIGAYVKTKKSESLELFARSPLNETIQIGTWNIVPSENGEYKELIFFAPKWYEDVIVRLKDREDVRVTSWDDPAVFVRSFSTTRINTSSIGYREDLMPTIFGSSVFEKELLVSKKQGESELNSTEWLFHAKGDFLRSVEFSGRVSGGGEQEYMLEIFLLDQNGTKGKAFRNVPFTLNALSTFRSSLGNYEIPVFTQLEKGRQYSIVLSRRSSVEGRGSLSLDTLGMGEDEHNRGVVDADMALHVGARFYWKGHAFFPDGAKLEDVGRILYYSFALQGLPIDYTNVFSMSEGVAFDGKKRLVTGKQKNGVFFTYKFDTVYSFEKFVVEAVQEGSGEHEIKLEYSFDNAFWREIPFVQESGQSQKFLLNLLNPGNEHEVYIRISYNGEEKKSGSFALKTFSVNASVVKPK